MTALAGDLLFFELELNRIDDARLEAAMAQRRRSRITGRGSKTSARRSRISSATRSSNCSSKSRSRAPPPGTGCSTKRSSALRFDFEGESLTLEPLLGKLQDADEKMREAAAKALAETLGANLRLFALITNTLAKDKEISDRWRKFKDVADSRHLANRVEREVVDALVAAVTDAYPRLSHRYYALKARWFGKEQLDHWDRNAPLPDAPQRDYPWEPGARHRARRLSRLLAAHGRHRRRFFDERWIDAPVRPGKAPGAFAHPTTPSAHPYVLLNYLGKPRDVMTLAHELGHGVHQVLAAPKAR